MAVRIKTTPATEDLFGKSHWWGFPDLPEGVDFPAIPDEGSEEDENLLTFICQIDLADIATFDHDNRLPHKGMLYFFAAIDYFLGDLDAPAANLGFWPDDLFRIIYAPDTSELHTHRVLWPDGSNACLPPEAVSFAEVRDCADGNKLLGRPSFEEVRDEAPDCISLLQIDEDERWGLRFYDCGMLNFLISPDDLDARRFSGCRLFFHTL